MEKLDRDLVESKMKYSSQSDKRDSDSGLSSGAQSIADLSAVAVDTSKILPDDVIFNNESFLRDTTTNVIRKKKQLPDPEIEKKHQEEEDYIKELHEQRYKRLLHLLNRSKFFSNYLKDKIKLPEKSKRKLIKKEIQDENISPPKKRAKSNRGLKLKYDIREYIEEKSTSNSKNEVNGVKKKINLSQEEIETELSAIDESENDVTADSVETPKYFLGSLRDYQKQGLQWLKVLYENGMNGILADEMGLGKTVQVIALFCHLVSKRQMGPYLIIAPLSTLPNWQSEFERFAPELPIVLLHGKPDIRRVAHKQIQSKHLVGKDFHMQPIVITTYEIARSDNLFLRGQNWRYIVVDEGQKVKNHECVLSRVLRTIPSMNRLILTGTPLQNDLSELWAILNFLLPDIFDDLALFESWFDAKEFQNDKGTEKLLKQEQEKQVLQLLREILKPFMLRREKEEHNLYKAVLNRDLTKLSKINYNPPIMYNSDGTRPKRRCTLRERKFYGNPTSYVKELDLSQRKISQSTKSLNETWNEVKPVDRKLLAEWKEYTDINDRNRDYLVRITPVSKWIMYKKVVNHPYLIHYPLDPHGLLKVDEELVKSSGKMLLLDALLARLKKKGHKVLLFSTMCMILDIIEDYLTMRGYKYVRLDGSTDVEDRKERIVQFNHDDDTFIFIMSTRAGGVGLNLTGADTVIIYDSDWNPQVDIQAMARCHRIGQTRPVLVYRLCTKGTIDETIIKRAEAKRLLEKMVISKDLEKEKKLDLQNLLEIKKILESEACDIITAENEEKMLKKILDRGEMMRSNLKTERDE
ncbi:lymphocyte-specific helicase-like isoform X2 [Prorops nasuta]|uniref:lymphocyte-specific helicase-like isoform X2 n=1 Tax=Prorops nasuta TaxID=863751 RepID=UPI0034CE289C